MLEFEQKKERLKKILYEYAGQDIMVAFSGGVDSSLLLRVVCEVNHEGNGRVYAATMKTRLHPAAEIENAASVAEEIGADHIVIPVDELLDAGIEDNPVDRCYLCKKHLFEKMKEKADELGVRVLMEGTNEDDLHVYRPGLRAIKELGVLSPLASAGFSKEEVRQLAAKYGLSVSDKPAAPCLATRFPYGTRISYEELERAADGEHYLKEFGFYNVRLRVHGTIARIEINSEEFADLLVHKEEIVSYLKKLGYSYITLDLEGFRSGSMDIGIEGV